MTEEQAAAISGAGIYLITRKPNSEVVYLGLFRPMVGDVISLRWARHLQTITWRGADIGLGPAPKKATPAKIERRKANLLAVTTNPDLRAVIQAAYDYDQSARYTSTGNDTSPNRLRFANENWNEFSAATPQTILDGFEFHLLRMRQARDQEAAATEVERIEKALLGMYKPICRLFAR